MRASLSRGDLSLFCYGTSDIAFGRCRYGIARNEDRQRIEHKQHVHDELPSARHACHTPDRCNRHGKERHHETRHKPASDSLSVARLLYHLASWDDFHLNDPYGDESIAHDARLTFRRAALPFASIPPFSLLSVPTIGDALGANPLFWVTPSPARQMSSVAAVAQKPSRSPTTWRAHSEISTDCLCDFSRSLSRSGNKNALHDVFRLSHRPHMQTLAVFPYPHCKERWA